MFLDVHCHLDQFSNPKSEIGKARERGVKVIVSNSVDLKSMKKNIALAKDFKEVECTIGVHPSNLLNLSERELDKALSFMEKNLHKTLGVGEIGLDFKHADSNQKKEKQLKHLELQLELAEKQKKPVIIHSRRACSECIQRLKEFDLNGIIFHWFSGSIRELKKALSLNGFFSIGPAVEFSEQIQVIAKNTPLNKLLSETDAPVPFKGKKSAPHWIPGVVEKIASLKAVKLKKLQQKIEKNYYRFKG